MAQKSFFKGLMKKFDWFFFEDFEWHWFDRFAFYGYLVITIIFMIIHFFGYFV